MTIFTWNVLLIMMPVFAAFSVVAEDSGLHLASAPVYIYGSINSRDDKRFLSPLAWILQLRPPPDRRRRSAAAESVDSSPSLF